MANGGTEYQQARKRVEARLGLYWHLVVYVFVNIVLLVVVGWDFLWATAFWGLGLASHAYAVSLRDRGPLHAWKERAIERELRGKQSPPPTQPMPSSEEPTKPIEE